VRCGWTVAAALEDIAERLHDAQAARTRPPPTPGSPTGAGAAALLGVARWARKTRKTSEDKGDKGESSEGGRSDRLERKQPSTPPTLRLSPASGPPPFVLKGSGSGSGGIAAQHAALLIGTTWRGKAARDVLRQHVEACILIGAVTRGALARSRTRELRRVRDAFLVLSIALLRWLKRRRAALSAAQGASCDSQGRAKSGGVQTHESISLEAAGESDDSVARTLSPNWPPSESEQQTLSQRAEELEFARKLAGRRLRRVQTAGVL
jgi:hypothetical protein